MAEATLSASAETRLTWEQICERYPDQWVVLVATYWTDFVRSRIRSAIVAGHGSKDESWERARPVREQYPETVHTQAHWTAPPWQDDGPPPVECACPCP